MAIAAGSPLMGYITAALGLQACSRRHARHASRVISLRRSQADDAAKAASQRPLLRGEIGSQAQDDRPGGPPARQVR